MKKEKASMPELPSIYSSHGLSDSDRKRVLTTGTPRNYNKYIGALKIESRVDDAVAGQKNEERTSPNIENLDEDGDIPMLGMDDEEEIQMVADYVIDKRTTDTIIDESSHIPDIESYIDERELTPEERPNKDTIMVVDTNFIISHLNVLDDLVKLSKKYHHKIIIPSTVMRELDGLKLSKKKSEDTINGSTIGHLARWANDWIYRKFAVSDSGVRGQRVREHLDPNTANDDAILDCCLYFQQKNDALVILLSNDKNLCMKALTNDVLTVSYRKNMSAELIAKMSFVENTSGSPIKREAFLHKEPEIHNYNYNKVDNEDDDQMIEDDYTQRPQSPQLQQVHNQEHIQRKHLQEEHTQQEASRPNNAYLITIDNFDDAAELIHKEVQTLVLNAIDYCMYAEYEEDLDLIGYEKSKVTTLRDSSNTLIHYWMSVFTEYFRTSHFKPFPTRGKKFPQFTNIPISETELQRFVDYWSNVLRALYVKRDDSQNSSLEKIIERWKHISASFQ